MDNVRCNYCEAVFADNEIILTTDEREKCPTCGEIGFIMDLERETTMNNNKTVYFVVGVNLETNTVFEDTETLSARFTEGTTWNEDEGYWEHETKEDYDKARDMFLSHKWETHK